MRFWLGWVQLNKRPFQSFELRGLASDQSCCRIVPQFIPYAERLDVHNRCWKHSKSGSVWRKSGQNSCGVAFSMHNWERRTLYLGDCGLTNEITYGYWNRRWSVTGSNSSSCCRLQGDDLELGLELNWRIGSWWLWKSRASISNAGTQKQESDVSSLRWKLYHQPGAEGKLKIVKNSDKLIKIKT